jgi:hypothetical protein
MQPAHHHSVLHNVFHHILHQGECILLLVATVICLVLEKTKKQAAAFSFAAAALKINELCTELFKISRIAVDLVDLSKTGISRARTHNSIISAGLGALYGTVFIIGWVTRSNNICAKVFGTVWATINFILSLPISLVIGLMALISFNRADIVALVAFEIYLAYFKMPIKCTVDNDGYFDGKVDYSGTSDLAFKFMAGFAVAVVLVSIVVEILVKHNERLLLVYYYFGLRSLDPTKKSRLQREDLLEKLAKVYAYDEETARNQRYRASMNDCLNPAVKSDEVLVNVHSAVGQVGHYDCIAASPDALAMAQSKAVSIDAVTTIGTSDAGTNHFGNGSHP